MNILEYNREAWNRQVEEHNRWTVPVSKEVIAAARKGVWVVVLTPTRPVPADWFPPLEGVDVLCLASGGGQQAPVLAAAGARVTVLDASQNQLEQDRFVALRDKLEIKTVQGDMAKLDAFPDESFDLIFHPCSNSFVPHIEPVWREAFRVLRAGGSLLAGFTNPLRYLFDETLMDEGVLQVKNRIPYSDLESLEKEELYKLLENKEPLAFGHTLEEQLGGQMRAGFAVTGFYEDRYEEDNDPLSSYIATFIATKATKLSAVR
ncbi:MAG TPA: class I SAM-dependent methyltransferase [Pyrinomonadaceae bacterium]|jgi:ubiquinone/menaquinone biosynthesis C-methylase UbiE